MRLFAILIVLLSAFPAVAQDMEQWEDFLRRGSEAYDAGDYETALLMYGKAQQLVDAPKLRLQIADIHEKLEECNAARLIYTTILDEEQPGTEVRQAAATRLEELATCGIESGDPQQPETSLTSEKWDPDEKPEVTEASLVPSEYRLPRGRKRAGIVLSAAGGVSLAAGLITTRGSFLPRDVKECSGINATAFCENLAERRATSVSEARDHADAVIGTHRLAAIGLVGGGAALLTTGIILLTTGKKPVVAVVPSVGALDVIVRF